MGGKHWTIQETDQLIELLSRYTDAQIALKLNRSTSSVKNKRRELGYGGFIDRNAVITFRDVERLCGLPKGTCSKSWTKRGLKYRKVAGVCNVKEENLIKFMLSHDDMWYASKCDYHYFARFSWFQKKYKAEKNKILPRKWTPEEIQTAHFMADRGCIYKKIADRLNRSAKSVAQRLCSDRKKEKLWSQIV